MCVCYSIVAGLLALLRIFITYSMSINKTNPVCLHSPPPISIPMRLHKQPPQNAYFMQKFIMINNGYEAPYQPILYTIYTV